MIGFRQFILEMNQNKNYDITVRVDGKLRKYPGGIPGSPTFIEQHKRAKKIVDQQRAMGQHVIFRSKRLHKKTESIL